jgi:hypothetical protein
MTESLSIETILAKFKEGNKAWVLKDVEVGKYVVIPHALPESRYHPFLSESCTG